MNKRINVWKTGTGITKWHQHYHPFWEIMYYTSGNGEMITSNGNIPFSPGTVICIPPGLSHGSDAADGFVNISMSCPEISFPGNAPIVCSDNENRDVYKLADMIYRMMLSEDDSKYKTALSLFNAYKEMICCLSFAKDMGTPSEIVHEFSRKMLENFASREYNIKKEIASTGYSDDRFREIYFEAYGTTPLRRLTKLRIDAAESMLIGNPEMSIKQIGLSLGFSDPLYFSRVYKKIKGTSPKQTREVYKSE